MKGPSTMNEDSANEKPLVELEVEIEDKPSTYEVYTSAGRRVRFDVPASRVVKIRETPTATEQPESDATARATR